MKKGIILIIAIIFIFIGICITIYPKISNIVEEKDQINVIKKYNEDVKGIEKENIKIEYKKAKEYNEILNQNNFNLKNIRYEEILNLSDNGIMSYIEIPKISVYLPIYHGTENEKMKKGVGHIENTSLPIGGESTHCVLTGHTGLIKTQIFTRLSELKLEDEVYIFTLDKELKYRVYDIKIVLPTEIEDLKIKENKDLLTLVTCTPYGVNTHRLLVQCERTEEIQNENKEFIQNVKKYKTIKVKYIIFIILVIIFCCILLNKIVKYIRKERK